MRKPCIQRQPNRDTSWIALAADFHACARPLEDAGNGEAIGALERSAHAKFYPLAEKFEAALKAAGAHPQRPLWASTSTKNPDYRDVMYVEELVAPGVVNTMPEATIHAFADHGVVKTGVVQSSYEQARATLAALAGLGIAYDDVTATLEREGVAKFEASLTELLGSVKSQLEAAGG